MDAAPDRSGSAISSHPALPGSQQVKPVTNYLFVSNIRFLSMAAVVLVHCISWVFPTTGISQFGWLERIMRQPAEFDVIGFFLISGFLMEEGLTRWRPAEYLARRFRMIFVPWLAWFSLYCGMMLANDVAHGRLRLDSMRGIVLAALKEMQYGLYSPYWFVPNLLFALCILLACRRYLFDPRMGCILLMLSLFHGLNLHAHWVSAGNHNEALFGFIFYLWLGAWWARNFAAIHAWIARTSMPSLLALAGLAGLAALLESSVLAATRSPNPMNVLRISNQVYSIAVVLVIFKLRNPVWPRAVNVRTTTFGIYLTHTIVLWLLIAVAKRTMLGDVAGLTGGAQEAAAVCLALGGFAAMYGSSLALTRWLLVHPRLRWMVGNFASDSLTGVREERTTGGSSIFRST
ncbi:MAG: acyltransferase [Terracidiphilus sp.]